MSLAISLNTIINNNSNHTVGIVAGSGVTTSSISSGNSSITRYSFTASSGVEKTVCTITFTAKTNFIYSKQPSFRLSSSSTSNYSITETNTFNSNNELTARVYTVKYTGTAVNNTDEIFFDYKLQAIRSSLNEFNNTLLEITNVGFDTSFIDYNGGSRQLQVFGDENAVFNLKITRNSDSKTYDFTTNEFTASATELTKQTIDSNGVFITQITIPAAGNVIYTFELTPSFIDGTTLTSFLRDTDNNFKHTFTLNQYAQVGTSFSCKSSNASYASFPTTTITSLFQQPLDKPTHVELSVTLNSNSFKISRQPVITDFESSTTATTSGSISNSKGPITLNDVSKLAVGMKLVHAPSNFAGVPTITGINTIDKTITISSNQSINSASTIEFVGSGPEFSAAISGCSFSMSNIELTIDEVSTTINDSDANGSSSLTSVDVASSNGIATGGVAFMSGLNIPESSVQVENVSTNTLTLSSGVRLENGQAVTFRGSSRSALIKFDVLIESGGDADTPILLNLDNILTVV